MTHHDAPLIEATPRRQRSRLATYLPARLTTLHGAAQLVLLDLSLTGARIRLPQDCHFARILSDRSEAVVNWFEFEAFGAIAWIRNRSSAYEAGLQFYDIINPQTLITTRDRFDQFRCDGGFKTVEREVARQWAQG